MDKNNNDFEKILNEEKILIIPCGTSSYAGLIAQYILEKYTMIPIIISYASKLNYQNTVSSKEEFEIAKHKSFKAINKIILNDIAEKIYQDIIDICKPDDSLNTIRTNAVSEKKNERQIVYAAANAFAKQINTLTVTALWLEKTKGTITNNDFLLYIKELKLIQEKITQTLASVEMSSTRI